MAIRRYANGPATTLVGSIGPTDTVLTVASATGFPSQFPYTIILDYKQGSEEAADVTAAVGNQLTVVRGVDSTTAFSHSAGAVVVHGITARDHREANLHVNSTTGVHGVVGALVGTTDTQTLTNKTLSTGTTINNATFTSGIFNGPLLKNAVVTPTAITDIGLVVRGLSGQTAQILEVERNDGSTVIGVSGAGRVGINTSPPTAVSMFIKNVPGDLDDLTLRIQNLAGQTGDPFSIVDSTAAERFKVNVSGHVFTAQVADIAGTLSVGPNATTLTVGAGATNLNIGQAASAINIGNTTATPIQIGRSAASGGAQVNINQNGAGFVSLPRDNLTLIGGQGITVQETTPPAPGTSRAVWINSQTGMVFKWDGGLNQWVQGAS